MFDENKIKNDLSGLSFKKQLVFAASCCERLLPFYSAFSKVQNWGNLALLQDALDKIWEIAKTEQFSNEEISTLSKFCNESIPDSDYFDSPYTFEAQNASSAVGLTLNYCLKKEISLLVGIARISWEAVEMYLKIVNDPIIEGIEDPQFDDWVETAPLLLAEINYQQQDIKLLSETELDNTMIDKIRLKSSKLGVQPIRRGLL